MKKQRELTTLEEIKAFSDPYRLKILTTFNRLDRPATVKEIADKIGEIPAKVHYHVKKLEKVNILELVDTKEVNGIIAKYYEPTAEEFLIKHTEDNDELSKVILSETQRVIINLYEESKNIIINEIPNVYGNKEKNKYINLSNIYMSNEDYKELTDLIEKFNHKKYSEDEKKNLTKYHFFNIIFNINKDE